jgi:hypothetical protein
MSRSTQFLRAAVVTLVAFAALAAAGSATAATYTFSPSDDARTEEATPSTNFGTLNLKAKVCGSPSACIRTFIKFNVAIPGSETVTAATLKGTSVGQSVAGFTTTASQSQTWSESTLTWANRPLMSTTVFGGSSGAWTCDGVADCVSANVTAIVTNDALHGGNTTIVLNSTNYAELLSKEDGSTVSPHLVVTTSGSATVPGAPTIGAATGSNTTGSVAYTAPGNNGGATIDNYRATCGSVTGTGTTSPLTVTGLTNGTAYTCTVAAHNSVGWSAESSASNSFTPSTVPGAPTIGTATAGNAQGSVAFTAPGSNGGAAIDTYRATCSPGSATATGSASPVVVTGLTNGTAYTCTVAAHNTNGYGAESSASNSFTPTSGGTTYVNETCSGDVGSGGDFANMDWFWGQTDMGYAQNPRWFAESGIMTLDGGSGRCRSDQDLFRMWTRSSEVGTFGDVKMSADYYFDAPRTGYTSQGWHGAKFWLRRKLCTNVEACSKINDNGDGNQLGYTAEFQLASNTIIIQKRDAYGCAGQPEPGYYILGSTSYTMPQDTWKNVAGTVKNNANGSVTIQVIVDGVVKLTATDSGACGSSPITSPGRVGVRTDFVNSLFDNIKVEAF